MTIYEDAVNRYEAKMAMPQYEAYRNNEKLAEALFADCYNEATVSYKLHNHHDKRRQQRQVISWNEL